uniref:Uncharacterized protein n=1 Tax=Romanomermis culicivorax TaxID=13658 RepID=A0A915IB60_ROMCU
MPFFGKSKKLVPQTSDPGNAVLNNSSVGESSSKMTATTTSNVEDRQHNRSLGSASTSHHKYRFFGKKSTISLKKLTPHQVSSVTETASTSFDQSSTKNHLPSYASSSSSDRNSNADDESRFRIPSSKNECLKFESIPESGVSSPPKIPPKPERLTVKCEKLDHDDAVKIGGDSTDQQHQIPIFENIDQQKSTEILCKTSPMFDLESPLKNFTFSDLNVVPSSPEETLSPNRRILLKRHLLNRLVSRHDPKLTNFVANLQRYCRRTLAKNKLNLLKEEIERLKIKLEKSECCIVELKSQCQSLGNRLTHSERMLDDEKQSTFLIGESLENENMLRKQLEDVLSKNQSQFDQLKLENQKLDQRLANYESVLDNFDNQHSPRQQNVDSSSTLTATEDDDRTERGFHGPMKIVEQRFSLVAGDFGQKMMENRDEIDDEDFKTAVESKMSTTADTIRSKIVRLKMRAAQLAGEKGNFDRILMEKEEKIDELMRINEQLKYDLTERENQLEILNKFRQQHEIVKNDNEKLKFELEEMKKEKTNIELEKHKVPIETENSELETLRIKCRELERKCACQQSELDDNVEEIENLRLKHSRLEILNQKLRFDDDKDQRRHEEELDEIKISMKKKIQNLEQQLEDEEKQKLRYQKQLKLFESELKDFRTNSATISPTKTEKYQNLKKTFVRTKFLLNDAQKYLEHFQKTATNRCALVQLKNQLEESENGRLFCLRQKQLLETDVADLKDELEILSKEKKNVDERLNILNKEKSRLEILTRDQELQINNLSKKFQNLYRQFCVDWNNSGRNPIKSILLNGNSAQKLAKSNSKTLTIEDEVRDFEVKFEVEHAEKMKAEAFRHRLQHELDTLRENLTFLKASKERDAETLDDYKRRLSKSRDEILQLQQRYADAEQKIAHLNGEIKRTDEENVVLKSDYDFASQRLENLRINLNLNVEDHHHHHPPPNQHRYRAVSSNQINRNSSSLIKNHRPQDSLIEEGEDEDEEFSDLEAEIAKFSCKNG